jgi:hypothetical protein
LMNVSLICFSMIDFVFCQFDPIGYRLCLHNSGTCNCQNQCTGSSNCAPFGLTASPQRLPHCDVQSRRTLWKRSQLPAHFLALGWHSLKKPQHISAPCRSSHNLWYVSCTFGGEPSQYGIRDSAHMKRYRTIRPLVTRLGCSRQPPSFPL